LSKAPRIPILRATLVITITVYGILGYALSSQPPAVLPTPVSRALAVVPLLIALINTSALGCLLAGWRAIRRGNVGTHRRLMLAAAALISLFLVLYVTRVVLAGVKAFAGPPAVRLYVYRPVLTVHIVLSIVSVAPVVHNLLIGLTYKTSEIARTSHSRVGRFAVTLWSISLTLVA